MADSISSNYELSVGLDYTDNGKSKTIYLKIPNPSASITESTIRTQVGAFINQGIVKDPTGEAFSTTSIGTAYTQRESKIDIDLN